jgi:alpha-galactosidase
VFHQLRTWLRWTMLSCLSLFWVSVAIKLGIAQTAESKPFHAWASTPPMGWNSWDCFATTVTEEQSKAQADYMAEHLAKHGWQFIVVDIQWYEPGAKSFEYRQDAKLTMDEWGRLQPAPNRFPSAADGVGFKALADYIHGKGLKFGIHLMRGIPRQAVAANTRVLGTKVHAADIANTASTCPWNPDMYGVDMSKPGAQEYYNSVFDLIAEWGVDFIKVDDISRPYDAVQQAEIEAIRGAIDRTARPMVLSLSPGETPLAKGEHVREHANMWRISDDFWDEWRLLNDQFDRLRNWTAYRKIGAYPDADMLPLGIIRQGKKTRFTPAEQVTLMTLWSIARSPLIHGGDMTQMDDFTLSLLTNDEVLAVNQTSQNNRELLRRDGHVVWIADVPDSADKYVALFNPKDANGATESETVSLTCHELGLDGSCRARDLWTHEDVEMNNTELSADVPYHGARLFRVSPQ